MSEDIVFHFLTAGPSFTAELPPVIESSAFRTATAVIAIRRDANREFHYVANRIQEEQASDIFKDHELVDENVADGGIPFRTYRRTVEPVIWTLEWELIYGRLYSHLRAEDGREYAAVVARSLRIGEPGEPIPYLLPEPPLVRVSDRRPGYQEIVSYYDRARAPRRALVFARPGSARAGQVTVGGGATSRGGSHEGIDVVLEGDWGDDDAQRRALKQVAASLQVAGSSTTAEAR